MNNLYRFQYYTVNDEPLLHQARDLPIIMELSEILFKREGYTYADAFMNYPGIREKEPFPYHFDDSDLMIMPTRPPKSDTESLHKRVIYKTGHQFEQAMFKQVGKCFISLSRKKSNLRHGLKRKIRPAFRNRGEISFRVNKKGKKMSAAYQKVTDYRIGEEESWSRISKIPHSCGFLMLFPAKGLLPRMLYVFGMGGQEGLMFARMLKLGLWDRLEIDLNGPARFVMVEFPINNIPDQPTSLEFVKKVKEKCEVVLDLEI